MLRLISIASIAAFGLVAADFIPQIDGIHFPEEESNDETIERTHDLPPANVSFDVSIPVDTKVIDHAAEPCIITLVNNHSYGFSYDKPYKGQYQAPKCAQDPEYSLVYLRYAANVDPGRQFDRIAAVWVDDTEILRTTTQEPNRVIGPSWEVFKDISHYRNIFLKGGNVTASLDNVVNPTYTSFFHVTVTIEYYKRDPEVEYVQRVPSLPDIVIPISKKNSLYPWFHVQPNTLGNNSNFVTLPKNLDGLFLELFISHHGCDEFHYTNPPDEFKAALETNCGGGSFREIQILIDGEVVSAVWPYPLIYTGGMSPALWRPIVSIGAFEVPTYIVDLTPFAARVLDGKAHNYTIAIDHGLDYWPATANLLVYLDHYVDETFATIDKKVFDKHVKPSVTSSGTGPNVTIHTTASRQVVVKSTITNSQGVRKYSIKQKFGYENHLVYSNNATDQYIEQLTTSQTRTTIKFQDGTYTTKTYSESYPLKVLYSYRPYTTGAREVEVEEPAIELPPFRLPHLNTNEYNSQESILANFYKLNVTIDHGIRQKLQVDGNKDDYRTAYDEFEVSIVQKADSRVDSQIGFNASNAVKVLSKNSTGCYSRTVKSFNGNYTKYTEGEKCPYGFRDVESVDVDDN